MGCSVISLFWYCKDNISRSLNVLCRITFYICTPPWIRYQVCLLGPLVLGVLMFMKLKREKSTLVSLPVAKSFWPSSFPCEDESKGRILDVHILWSFKISLPSWWIVTVYNPSYRYHACFPSRFLPTLKNEWQENRTIYLSNLTLHFPVGDRGKHLHMPAPRPALEPKPWDQSLAPLRFSRREGKARIPWGYDAQVIHLGGP